ncbi:MAG: hypothetical protein KKG04_10745 [Candidatus Thermoplasmatota archaeon]|nr:hypothetical protein [Candidatus Thermoplasmatota archaeon]
MARIKLPFISLMRTNFPLFLTIMLILIALIYAVWVGIVALGVYFLGLSNTWAGMSMEQWLYSGIALLILFIIFTLVYHFLPEVMKLLQLKKQQKKPQYYQGKRMFDFTYPRVSEGGIYSRTYVSIDENQIINFRYQMIPPEDLWHVK